MSLKSENIVLNKWVFDDAERAYYTKTAITPCTIGNSTESSIKQEFGKLKATLRAEIGSAESNLDVQSLLDRLNKLELENSTLKTQLKTLENRVNGLENSSSTKPASASTQAPSAAKVESNDDDFELFGEDEDTEEKRRITEERVKAYADKKTKKPALIAKSSVMLDVKPWDDETDLVAMENAVRSVQMDGLLWGTSKLVPVAYGVKKLQITCVIEDDKVSTELLEENLCAFEDYVQSVDIVAFNKI